MGTVETQYAPERFSTDGSTTTFAFSFPIKLTTDLTVYLVDDTTLVPTTLVITTDYSLSATNNDYSSGGTITTVATYASGSSIVAVRDSAQTQDMNLQRGQGVPEETLEAVLDRQTMNIQDNSAIRDISVRAPVTDDSPSMELPNSVDRASKNLGFDASGNVTVTDSNGTFATANAWWDDVITKSPWADVRAYGAEGDGTTDDTAAFNAAFAASFNVLIPAGNYRLDGGNISVRLGTYIKTGGYDTELHFYGLSATDDGLVIADGASNPYDFLIIEPMKIRTMDSNGRYGIVTPVTSGLYTNKRPQYYIEALFIGEDLTKTIFTYGWADCVRIGDCRGGKLDLTIYGRYNPTITDSGQADSVGLRLIGTTGCIGLDIMGNIQTVRRAIVLDDGTEGISIGRGSNLYNCYIGIEAENASSEPGGFISDTHINATSRGIVLLNRSEMNISNVSIYRSDAYFDDAAQWIAIDCNTCPFRMNFNNININPGTTFTGGEVGMNFYNCLGVNINNVNNYADNTGFKFEDTTFATVDNVLISNTTTGFDFDGTSANIRVGKVNQRGTVTTFDSYESTVIRSSVELDMVRTLVIDANATEIKALAATPLELVAAQGANTLIEFLSATLILNYGSEALAEPSAPDDLAIEYDNGTGTQIATWDTTGFITSNADAMEIVHGASVGGAAGAIATATNVNKNIALINTGGEYTGNATGDTTLRVYVTYRLHTALGL
jgi:hypothetical protein